MVPAEHRIYARWLDRGTRIGLALLVASFAVYVGGLLQPLVAHEELARLWSLPADRYVAATGAPTGWRWVGFLHKGDYLTFVGIAVFASITIVCYARIVATLLAQGDRLRVALASMQLVILVAAASGWIA